MKKQQQKNNNNNNKQSETKQYFYCIFKLENNCLKSVSIVKSKNFQQYFWRVFSKNNNTETNKPYSESTVILTHFM